MPFCFWCYGKNIKTLLSWPLASIQYSVVNYSHHAYISEVYTLSSTSSHFSPGYLQPLATTILLSVPMTLLFLGSTYKWDHTGFVFSHLTYFTWLSGSIHVVTNGRISFFFFFLMDKIIFRCTYILGWPKVSFWYFHKILRKNLSKPFGQPNTLFFFACVCGFSLVVAHGLLTVAWRFLLFWSESFRAHTLRSCGT